MSTSYNLVDEPWIPCRTANGVRQCGLKETLLRAHEIAELRDASPLVTVALHRLLLAILHRTFGPASAAAWKRLWDGRRFPAEPLEAYFTQHRDRFDLFDERRPFYQDAAFRAKAPGGINQLVRELARGNNATLFDHTAEDPPPALPPAIVARALIAEQAYAVGGGKSELGYTTSGPLVGSVAVLIRGETLFETLVLNLIRYPDTEGFPAEEDDAPVWERCDRPIDGSPSPNGYLDYLTWQSRSILLHTDSADLRCRVSALSYAQGRKLAPATYDPMVPYRSDEEGDRAIRLSEAKDLWRDSAALFQLKKPDLTRKKNGKVFRAPEALRWLQQLVVANYLPRDRAFSLSAIGLCTDKAKVNFWRHDALPLPLDYLTDPALVETLQSALDLADDVAQGLRGATATVARTVLAPGEMPADKDRVWAMVDALAPDRLYWSRLEIPFRELLVRLPGDTAHQKRERDAWFTITLRKTALTAFRESAGQLDHSARVLRAVVLGDQQLRRSLAKIARDNNVQQSNEQGVPA